MTKTITIEVPVEYNYICRQPDGMYLLSTEKPILTNFGNGEFWETSGNSVEIIGPALPENNSSWKNSLIEIESYYPIGTLSD